MSKLKGNNLKFAKELEKTYKPDSGTVFPIDFPDGIARYRMYGDWHEAPVINIDDIGNN